MLPTFAKFQKEKGLTAEDSFLSFPKVYAWTADEINGIYALMLEDVRAQIFEMWPRHDPITLRHEEIVLERLGRFMEFRLR